MKRSALRWLYDTAGGKKLYILSLTVVQAIHGASGVFYALLLRAVVDAATLGDGAAFRRNMALIIALVTIQLLLRAMIRYLTELSKSGLENAFKARLMDTLLKKDYLSVSSVHSGEWINRLTSDTVVAANGCVDILPGAIGMAVKLVSALIMIAALEPRFAVIIIPGGALLVLATLFFRRVLKRLHKDVQEADGRLRVSLHESIWSLLIIHSFAAEKTTAEETGDKMAEHRAARMRKNRFSNFCNLGFGAVMSGMYILGVGWCGLGMLTGTVSFGTLTAVTQLISQIQAPFAGISSYLPQYYAMLASAERLMDAESFDDDGQSLKKPEEVKEIYDKRLESVALENVSFSYVKEDKDGESAAMALENLSLEIHKGETVALTGESGCGKSTALKLLMCVYSPVSGTRFYTEQDGQRHELSAEYRRLFAYVPQGNMLMSGTIRQIVSFSRRHDAENDEKLMYALRIACADGFTSELEQGVDTQLGERGAGLSEGQLQRLAIARAVFSESPILLLDEATSALDAETELRLLENLKGMRDRTVVIVTHRQAALKYCDRVISLDRHL